METTISQYDTITEESTITKDEFSTLLSTITTIPTEVVLVSISSGFLISLSLILFLFLKIRQRKIQDFQKAFWLKNENLSLEMKAKQKEANWLKDEDLG
jgi:hypothetical protein